MLKRLSISALWAAAAVLAAACSTMNSADRDLKALTARGDALRASLAKEQSATPALRADFDRLIIDAQAWSRRTGRSDVRNEAVTTETAVA